ncbi:glycosyltransferase family 2 protein [Clostridium beijerinckii]|uniref:glycosyltransferase family 2 protein n=1 Tax=Clostridium beijerinckii TaxID=1520 RepID=UPI0006843874|nr:glycosyltransferase [Clostridium beijerinckii]
MENIELSIIIPIYNVEKYLRNCLDSVINQTLDSIEIIMVNDGSTDNSGRICEEYNRKYANIRLISQRNKGLGAARNEGIRHARGRYIGFVDSDDYILKDMYKEMLSVAMGDDLDLIICAVKMYYEESKKQRIIENIINEENIIARKELIKHILSRKIQCFAWNKIYKRELFDGIKYEEGVYYEDMFTMYNIALRCKKAKVITKPFYIYRQRENNITSKVSLKHINDFNLAVEKVSNKFINGEFYDNNLLMAFNIISLNTSLDLYIRQKNFTNKEIYKDYKEVYNGFQKYNLLEIIINKYIPFKYKKNYILFKIGILPVLKKIVTILK